VLFGVTLVAAVALVYGRAIGFGFVTFDDPAYVRDNAQVLSGLSLEGVRWAFTTFGEANWHPLTWLSLMLDAEIGGAGSWIYHLTNLVLHAASTLLLFGLLTTTTDRMKRSAFVAALFAVHPLHVESVAWISERKDVLSGMFAMITLLAYVGYVRRPGPWRYALTLLCFALGLMAKPMLVTLPVLMMLLDIWPLRRIDPTRPALALRESLPDKLPLLLLSAASSLVALFAQHRGGAISSLDLLPLPERFASALVSYVAYLKLTVWPVGLAAIYPYTRGEPPIWRLIPAALLLGFLTFLAVRALRRRSPAGVGWLWYLVALLPVIGLIQVGPQAIADRYTYLPHVGLFIAVAWGAPGILAGRPLLLRSLATIAVVVVVALGAVAWNQVGYWRDGVTLFERAVSVTTRNARAHDGLGRALHHRGESARAIASFRRAVEIDPRYADAHCNLARALELAGRAEESLDHFERGLQLDPDDAECRVSYGTALIKRSRLGLARAELEEAVRLDPDQLSAHKNLGVVMARLGELESAITHFQEALRIDPADEGARRNLERARLMLREP
jgi:Flp pilus assembly protein TadD